MDAKTVSVFFLLGLAVAQAIPTAKVVRTLREEDLKIDDEGKMRERYKKSVFITGQSAPVIKDQAYNMQLGAQPGQTLSIKHPTRYGQVSNAQSAVQSVQTASLQTVPQVAETISIQSGSQPVETVSFQTGPQQVQTFAIQQPGQVVQTFSLQPTQQQAQVFGIQSVPQVAETVSIQTGPQQVQTLSIQQPGQSAQSMNVQSAVHRPGQSVQTFNVQPVQEIVQPAAETVVVSQVNGKEIVNVASVLPIYEKQVVINPAESVVILSEPEVIASYVNPSPVRYPYKPQVLASVSSSDVVLEPISVIKESSVVKSKMING